MTSTDLDVKPFLMGVFALYDTPDGGVHLSYRPDGEDEDVHVQLPAALVSMAKTGKVPSPKALMKMLWS